MLQVRKFLRQIDTAKVEDPTSKGLIKLIKRERSLIDQMLKGADRLGKVLRDKPPQFFLCHADIHGWNVIIQPDGSFYVVDWDIVTLAPKERDLMSIASGLFGKDRTPEEVVEIAM